MSQVKKPHGKLVECRNAIEKVLKKSRKEAAEICNRLTHADVEAVLAAGEDAEKMVKAVSEPQTPRPPKEEPKTTKTTTKK